MIAGEILAHAFPAAAAADGRVMLEKEWGRDGNCCPRRIELAARVAGVVIAGGGDGRDRVVLAALVQLTTLITGSPGAEGLIEAVAETAQKLLRADSLSISRLEQTSAPCGR